MKVHYDFNDILITPAVTSSIRSRKEINPYHLNIGETNWLPIIVSPMDTVIDTNNWQKFLNEKMPICFPRGITPDTQLDLCDFDFSEQCDFNLCFSVLNVSPTYLTSFVIGSINL